MARLPSRAIVFLTTVALRAHVRSSERLGKMYFWGILEIICGILEFIVVAYGGDPIFAVMGALFITIGVAFIINDFLNGY
jgi:uncharacterized membrane protein HdeD (DUF308 family)